MSTVFPRCTVVPLPDKQVALCIDDRECLRWHYGSHLPRPFFFPVVGPSGKTLTRMGHPGAPDHDQHRSLWLAHSDLMGQNFWGEGLSPKIIQHEWFAYEDGDDFARMAVHLHWIDGHDPRPLLRHELFVTLRPLTTDREWELELQSDFYADADGVEFRKSNFGILALRVTKSLSAHFGGGIITGASGKQGEPATFGEPNRWVDYSGPILQGPDGQTVIEGLTLIDHPENPGHPARWHTRADGWVGPSLTRSEGLVITCGTPQTVRYLLYVHAGPADPVRIDPLAVSFAARPKLQRIKSKVPHVRWQLV